MAGGALRDQAFSLLAAANNHSDLAVKLSSLKQAKDILLSVEPSSAAELFPYVADLQSSPESLVRKTLIEVIEEIGLKAMEHSSVLLPVLLAFLRDRDSIVARQSIVSGTHFFCSVLEEMALQFHRRGKVERRLEELWMWMAKFKDVVLAIAMEPGYIGTRLLAFKFLETYVLLFTSEANDSEKPALEGSKRAFNISWLVGGHPVLDPAVLMTEANRTLGFLLDFLQLVGSVPGSLTITVVNCLAAIARKRPLHYSTVLSALLDFNPNFEMVKGCHAASVQYSLRTAFLGFLRCTYPSIVESRDTLLKALRAMNAGDAADQVIRQVEKMIKSNERALRDARSKLISNSQDDQLSGQRPISGDLLRKRSMPWDNEEPIDTHEGASKRIRYGPNTHSAMSGQINDSGKDSISVNGESRNVPLLDSDLTPVEQMIAIIGAFLAEGERGVESLEILISEIHPDLLADIVITNMKHLPKNPQPLTRLGNSPITRQIGSLSSSVQVATVSAPTNPMQSPVLSPQLPFSSPTATSILFSDTSNVDNFPTDSKRDPRRDPRRLDPRRAAVPLMSAEEESDGMQSDFDGSIPLNKSLSLPNPIPGVTNVESAPLMSEIKSDDKILESPSISGIDKLIPKEDILDGHEEIVPIPEVNSTPDLALSPVCTLDEDSVAAKLPDVAVTNGSDTASLLDFNQHSPAVSNTSASEETFQDLPLPPSYVELTEEQQRLVRKLAVERIVESYKHLLRAYCSQTGMALLTRLVAQIDADDDVIKMLHKHIVEDYQQIKGHELVLHILYHVHSLTISDSVEKFSFGLVYEKFLLAVAKSLLDTYPATDKSFSRLLGEVPLLPDSALKLLDDICYSNVSDHKGNPIREVERVTQGLGAVWSLILGRPCNRQACLNIALKCAVHLQDSIRAKAIRLVANKLFPLSYLSENIEQFATSMLLSAVDNISDIDISQSGSSAQRSEVEVGSQETSMSGSQVSEPETSENDSMKGTQPVPQGASTVSTSEAHRLISLYFALCTKKPSLLQLVFDTYGKAPKIVKQAVHDHIPILIRALGSSSCSEFLGIVSDPPQGSENLLALVLEILTGLAAPSSDLITAVKHLYETKLKDASILIPMLSSLSKDEVLPIFPRLVDLPIEKFKAALAPILQGSAHTRPALTPAEVLVAIHDISPEKDGPALKKIMEACSACFEQRTVFTPQVLAKALNQMVDRTPLPLLFMRTVIQAIDAFPSMVDFVMGILSKLVSKQVWRMPKLWVGFLKCVSQTQPHSFHVLLQLPPPQLESALNKHANLRNSLAVYASQENIRGSLPRATLAVLGRVNEARMQQPHLSSSLQPSDTSSSVHGATLT